MTLTISYDISTSSLPGFIGEFDNESIWFYTPESDPDNTMSRFQDYMGADRIFRAPVMSIVGFLMSRNVKFIHDSESDLPGESTKLSRHLISQLT